MSIKLSVSNSLDSLVNDLGENLKSSRGNVFAPHYIITQTDGMNVWLKHKLAVHLGIVANIDFKKPNDLIFRLYILLGGKFLDTLSRENLVWLLYQLIGETDFNKRFPKQAAYFNTAGIEKDLKRMGLAEKLADLFDQYQIFRPEMIKEWNDWDLNHPNIEWQSFLWIKAKALSASELPDKTIVSDFIMEQLKDAGKVRKLQQQLPSVYLFGLSIVTRYHMDIYTALADVVKVQFYLLNPAPEIYWLDDRSEKEIIIWKQKGVPDTDTQIIGNSLLTAWGKVLQNTFRLLFRNEDIINSYETIDTIEPNPTSLLKKIQWDIFNNAVTERCSIEEENLSDTSIVVQSCYTVAREVEALYHYLAHLIDKKEAVLSSRDIVVMVSDIDLYAPYIKAVFDNAPYPFKYRIADTSISKGDNLLSALQAVLNLNEDNFTSENVMQLLEASFIRKRFGLNDVEKLRIYVDAANIRFGMHGNEAYETNLVSWSYGLKRMMFGVCMSGGEAFESEGEVLYPLDIVEGSDAWETIRFVHFVEVLMSSIKNRNYNRSIADWVKYIEHLVHDLIFLPEEEAVYEEYGHLMEQLKDFNLINDLLKESLPYDIFSKHLLNTIELQTNATLFHNAGITFCSFIPMRSIPFKVVAMLGMDQQHFPRRENTLNFNLMNQKHMLGDRNVKDNDKHLFLETVLSAREFLYISYLGSSVKDNTELPASILVDELLDYIQAGMEADVNVKKIMVVHQPLQEFSRKYNSNDDKLYRYSGLESARDKELFTKDKIMEAIDFSEIPFKDLISFYKNTVQFFYNKRLGIYYNSPEMALTETELFELDSLQQWNLKRQLLVMDTNVEEEQLREQWVRLGILPLKYAGASALSKMKESIAPFRDALMKESGGLASVPIPFSVMLGESNISGKLEHIYGGKYIYICWSANVIKYMIEAYLHVLMGVATQHVYSAVFIYGKEEPTVLTMNLTDITQQTAIVKLMELRDWFEKGLESMIPFVDILYKEHKVVDVMDNTIMESIFQKAFDNYTASNTDPYLWNAYSLGYFKNEAVIARFQETYRLIVLPLFEVFNGHKF